MRPRTTARNKYNGPLIYRRDIAWGVLIFTVLATLILIFGFTMKLSSATQVPPAAHTPSPTVSITPYVTMYLDSNTETLKQVSYRGWRGTTPLALLRQHTTVRLGKEQHRVIVTAINGRAVNHGEYWMLYINGVSSLDINTYITKDSDFLTWILIRR
jgi:hypothetical protein